MITYQSCKKVYIGQSKRTAHSQIKEDLCNANEQPFLYSQCHNIRRRDFFTWKIVQKIQDLNTLHIDINAGCTAKEMLSYLKSIDYFFISPSLIET